ncbi:MAG TPA: hypothetical protein VL976_08980 [Xanthobacteraceae bacterium]|nr:hypothetical protein [Xanthobacteraceae bacterium]
MSLHADADILAAHSRPPLRSLAARRATFAATDRRQLSAGRFSHDQLSGPIANDFVNVWAAGRLALDGDPAAYDWNVHKAAEVRALGHDFAAYYGWHYAPPALFSGQSRVWTAVVVDVALQQNPRHTDCAGLSGVRNQPMR